MRLSILLAALVALPASAAPPRLGVVLVVDQMRHDYLERSDLPDGGFRALREGARFTEARHLHFPTETGPGHAAISTGRLPATHGIVANDWYDRHAATETYCVGDAAYGAGPEHLMGPTLADALKAADPRARVFAVSAKDRSAVLLGGRRPDVVLWFDRFRGEFATSAYYARPNWLDAFNAKLKKDGLLPVRQGKVPKDLLASAAMDEATDRLVEELMKREKVGRGPRDLLLVSYTGTDLVGHRHGTEGPAMDAQLAALDAVLGKLLARARAASGADFVLALSADHGAVHAPEDPSGIREGVRRKDYLKFRGELETELQREWPMPGAEWVVSYQPPHIYLDRAKAAGRGPAWDAFLRRAAKALSRADGVARVVVGADSATLPESDPLADVLRRSWRPDRSGDLLVVMAERVLLHDQAPGTSHGTVWDYDARVPLVFLGRGVRPGRYAGPSAAVDLAPTLGLLLGLDYPAADGGTLRREAVAEAP